MKTTGKAVPPPVVGIALIDTGATITTIDTHVAETLKLAYSGRVDAIGIGGKVIGYKVACVVAIRGRPSIGTRINCHDLTVHAPHLIGRCPGFR